MVFFKGGMKKGKKDETDLSGTDGKFEIKTIIITALLVTKVAASKPWAVIKPAPSCQAGLADGGDLPTPGFLLFEADSGVGTIPALVTAVGPILGPKSYSQAFVGLAGPGQANFSCPSKNGDQIGKNSMTPEAKPARTNNQPSQDGPPKSQTTVPENPKNDCEAANQMAEPEMPSLATKIAPEKCSEALAYE
ncbi:hypothetical protein DSO57_1009506 [Entomophthora muscae]|uniref:Uncharacterized protein n=1 Tax=Entomophthora muscae TaxID=34485 RepID=A0ACC2URK5_9FUNG|nr:hypothetical protein DSO57_1009506 [Entomophthora muscae]